MQEAGYKEDSAEQTPKNVSVYHSYYEKCLIISRVLKDRCMHLIWNFDLFEQVPRVYPETSYYKNWFDVLSEPDHIIDNIWVGSAFNAADDKWLMANNIKVVINVTKCIGNYFPSYFTYYQYPVEDLNGESISNYFNNFYRTVVMHRDRGERMLVHCYAGRSRSASLVLYYILKRYGMTMNEALVYLAEKRPQININMSFIRDIEDLLCFERIAGRAKLLSPSDSED